MIIDVTRREVRVGDVVLDAAGRPFFEVKRVDPAKMRGYIVFTGSCVRPVDNGTSWTSANRLSGHELNILKVERRDDRRTT